MDLSGNAYVAGMTGSGDFPTANPLQASMAWGFDAFVAKLNASGTVLIYSTYIGGSGNDTAAHIALDSSGNAYVTGTERDEVAASAARAYDRGYDPIGVARQAIASVASGDRAELLRHLDFPNNSQRVQGIVELASPPSRSGLH